MSTKEAPEAAEVALAMSECMSLLFLFAAPRVLAAVQRSGGAGLDGPHSMSSLRRFLHKASAIRARAAASEDVDRLVRAAIVVEEIAGAMGASGLSDPLPSAITDRARKALSILGFEEPAGGWEEFEGFSVPYPPPSPRREAAAR